MTLHLVVGISQYYRHKWTRTHAILHAYTCIYKHTHARMHTHARTCLHMHAQTHTQKNAYTHTHTHTNTHTHTHTFKATHTQKRKHKRNPTHTHRPSGLPLRVTHPPLRRRSPGAEGGHHRVPAVGLLPAAAAPRGAGLLRLPGPPAPPLQLPGDPLLRRRPGLQRPAERRALLHHGGLWVRIP